MSQGLLKIITALKYYSTSEFAFMESEPKPLLRLCVRDSRYTPRGVVRSTDQREYRIARPLTARKGARPRTKAHTTHKVLKNGM